MYSAHLGPWRTYEISTVVDICAYSLSRKPWRTYEISTVVDSIHRAVFVTLGEPMKFLLL